MLTVTPISAFNDNYIWLLRNNDSRECVAVDPGDAAPLLAYLQEHDLQLTDILITHHHADHTGGIAELKKQVKGVKVYAPKHDPVKEVDHAVTEGEKIHLASINANFEVLEIPGHTLGHVAYFGEGLLFSGDTLFAAGCGRVFEGTYEQMYQSLQKIARLPANTAIYCGHEYTQANLKFAAAVEPTNPEIKNRIVQVAKLRDEHKVSLPSTLELEKKTNPFLRCEVPQVIDAAQQKTKANNSEPVFVFKAIRDWKDAF